MRAVVVTGATSGLGRAAAGALAAQPDWTVVVTARDETRGCATARALQAAPGSHVVTLPLDLADLSSVRAFPQALAEADLPPLAAVVANAGIQYRDRLHTTDDGFEATFVTNHLGHFLLLRLLLPSLADDGRIVIVASGTHKDRRVRNGGFPPPRWEDPRVLATPGPGSGQVAYATSKLANVMTTLELERRLPELRPGSRIAVHGFDPGLMPDTALSRNFPPAVQRIYLRLAPAIARAVPGAQTSAEAGRQLAGMVTAPGFAGPRGRYMELGRDGEPSAQARDAALAAELWEASEALVDLARSAS